MPDTTSAPDAAVTATPASNVADADRTATTVSSPWCSIVNVPEMVPRLPTAIPLATTVSFTEGVSPVVSNATVTEVDGITSPPAVTATVAVIDPTTPSSEMVKPRTPLLMVATVPKVRLMSSAVRVTAPVVSFRSTVKVPVSSWPPTVSVAASVTVSVIWKPSTESSTSAPVSVAGPRWSVTSSAARAMSGEAPRVTVPLTPVASASPATETAPAETVTVTTPVSLEITRFPVALTGPKCRLMPLPETVVSPSSAMDTARVPPTAQSPGASASVTRAAALSE